MTLSDLSELIAYLLVAIALLYILYLAVVHAQELLTKVVESARPIVVYVDTDTNTVAIRPIG